MMAFRLHRAGGFLASRDQRAELFEAALKRF